MNMKIKFYLVALIVSIHLSSSIFAMNDDNDDVQNITVLRIAANQGDLDAQWKLGLVYIKNSGAKDDEKSVYWFRKMADQGSAKAQSKLGFMYENGFDVPQDDYQAIYWYQKAAEQGYELAKSSLADMYRRGKGGELAKPYANHSIFLRKIERPEDLKNFKTMPVTTQHQQNQEQEYTWKSAWGIFGIIPYVKFLLS